jgi:hypothetical protein
MQRAFSAKMAQSGDPAYSAEKAGYASPVNTGAKLMHLADVAEDVRRRARHRLQTEGAEVAVRVLIEIALDEKQKASSRVAAAGKLGQMSGIASAATLSPEDLAELPADQIRALLGEAQRALEARMQKLKTIEHEPAESPQIAQAAPNLFD